MKKITAVLICILIALSSFAVNGFAVSEKEGMDALKKQFKSGKSILDYVYYLAQIYREHLPLHKLKMFQLKAQTIKLKLIILKLSY